VVRVARVAKRRDGGRYGNEEVDMNIIKFILKIPAKLLLTIAYPLIYLIFIRGTLDQLSGQNTGFLEPLINIWKW
jgi:hypothetical protein